VKFSINSILLWPKKKEFQFKRIMFEPGKVNVITGASRTGKSAIIPIIDYCLGSDKCTIPVETIRNSCEWFGVLLDLDSEQLLLCRKEPGAHNSTGEMYFARGTGLNIPNTIIANITVQQVKNMLNELFSMSFLELDPASPTNYFSARPSYRDFMAFIFQPQNIIANADVLFYKADTSEHRLKLINIFPYVLGAVTPQVLSARQEIERIRKEKDRLSRELANIKDVSENWKQEVHSWLSRSRELGLTNYIWDDRNSFTQHIDQLRNILGKTERDSTIVYKNIKDASDELNLLRQEEQEISSKLFAAQKRYEDMKQLSKSIGQYNQSLQIQLDRLNISGWLRSLTENNKCPICGNLHTNSKEILDKLCDSIEEIEQTAGNMESVPVAFERELHAVENDIQLFSDKLSAIRRRINEESGRYKDNSDKKYTLNNVARFLGNIENAVQTYEKIGTDSELEQKLNELENRLSDLLKIVNENDIRNKMKAALRYIEIEANKLVSELDVERPDDPIEFRINDLTICVKNNSGRDDYLWEIGSASNWLSYHISTILSFQKYFQTKKGVAVPNFMVFDQPSQVYFPHTFSRGFSRIDEEKINDEDKEAVRKIFLTLSKYVKDNNFNVQILVLEHADEDVWGNIDNIYLVKKWRGNNEKLIPNEWIQ
jgi:uncharacterized membrane-anchored protein YhcB (DUF1043 family)